MLCCIVSLGVGRLFNNSLIPTILASCLFDWRCVFMLSGSSSSLSSFPHPYLLCLHSCRQWDLRQTCPPAAYSLSFSTVPVAGCWRPCSLLLSLLVLCSHQGLQLGGGTLSGTLAGSLWLCWSMWAWEIWASNYSTCSSDVLLHSSKHKENVAIHL